jgi:predicted AlkP superfamily phosphohydrolase/phosphomutase
VPPEARRFLPQANNHVDAGVRLNLTGREPAGRLAPGPEAEAAAGWLTARLQRLEDADTGAPVVRRVLRTRDHYAGPHIDALPDLVVQWNREGWVRAVRSDDVGTLEGGYPGPRSGDHTPEGLLVLSGPEAAPGAVLPAVAVQDIAPTVAALLGTEMPEAEGRARMDVVQALRSGLLRPPSEAGQRPAR